MALQQALDHRRYVARHELKGSDLIAAKRKAEGELGGGDVLDDQRLAGHQHVPLALRGVHEHGDGLIFVHTGLALGHGQFGEVTPKHIIVAADCAGRAALYFQVRLITGLCLRDHAHRPATIAALILEADVRHGAGQPRPNQRIREQVQRSIRKNNVSVGLTEFET